MTLYEYVAFKNPNGAKDIINGYGKKAIRHPRLLARQLAGTVNAYGEEALQKIAAIHPDKELIAEYLEATTAVKPKDCECDKKNDFLNANGQEIKKTVEQIAQKQEMAAHKTEPKSEKTELLILGAVTIIGLALILKK